MKGLFALVGGALLCANALANDVITLKDGKVIEGQIYRTLENGDLCVHKLDGNDILVFATDILSRTQNEKVFSTGFKETKESGPIGLGVKLSYVHGFNSVTSTGRKNYNFKSTWENGNGVNFGVSYTLGLDRYFFFEPGANLTFLHYNYRFDYSYDDLEYDYLSDSSYSKIKYRSIRSDVDLLGFEIPLQLGCRVGLGKLCEWEFKVGPYFSMSWNLSDYSPGPMNLSGYSYVPIIMTYGPNNESRCEIGVQFDTGIKIKKEHYIGVGFQLCCWQQEQTDYWLNSDLNTKRNSLNVTYGYYF